MPSLVVSETLENFNYSIKGNRDFEGFWSLLWIEWLTGE